MSMFSARIPGKNKEQEETNKTVKCSPFQDVKSWLYIGAFTHTDNDWFLGRVT